MSKTLLIFICIFLVIAFVVSYGDLYYKWKGEKYRRIFAEAFAKSCERDSEHYQQLYYDCLNQSEDSPSGKYWWEE